MRSAPESPRPPQIRCRAYRLGCDSLQTQWDPIHKGPYRGSQNTRETALLYSACIAAVAASCIGKWTSSGAETAIPCVQMHELSIYIYIYICVCVYIYIYTNRNNNKYCDYYFFHAGKGKIPYA